MLGSDGEYSKTNFLYSTMILCGFDYFLKLLNNFYCLLCLKYDGYIMSDYGINIEPFIINHKLDIQKIINYDVIFHTPITRYVLHLNTYVWLN